MRDQELKAILIAYNYGEKAVVKLFEQLITRYEERGQKLQEKERAVAVLNDQVRNLEAHVARDSSSYGWKKLWEETWAKFRVVTGWTTSGFIDSVFLVLWVLTQWGTAKVISNFELYDIDQWVFLAFQLIFAFSTLVPVVIYIYADTRIIVLRANRQIQKEKVSELYGRDRA